jgi:hypothetical protein
MQERQTQIWFQNRSVYVHCVFNTIFDILSFAVAQRLSYRTENITPSSWILALTALRSLQHLPLSCIISYTKTDVSARRNF